MAARGENGAGRLSVDFIVANQRDIVRSEDGRLAPEKVRRQTMRGVVDCGAVRLALPKTEELGLKPSGRVKVRYADGRTATRDTVELVHVELLGRSETFSAIVEPKRKSALIGAIFRSTRFARGLHSPAARAP